MNTTTKKQNNTNKQINNGKGEKGQDAAPAQAKPQSWAWRVQAAYANGEVRCGNPAHFSKGSEPILGPDGQPRLGPKGNASYRITCVSLLAQEGGWRRILSEMMPGDTAGCPCERAACETAWKPHHQDHVRYGSRYVAEGSFKMGIEGAGNRQLFVTSLHLSDEVKKKLIAVHSNYYFIGGSTYHSHPFMHITTQIATRQLWDRLLHLAKGKEVFRVTDLHGNPHANARMQKDHRELNITTMVELNAAEDCVRMRNKWYGSPFRVASVKDCGSDYDPSTRMEEQDAVMSVHTMYYYDRSDVNALVAKLPESSSMWAVMHKFAVADGVTKGSADDKGTFGHGEVTWTRTKSGRQDRAGNPIYVITQTDAKTGKCYIHDDNSHWFDRTSWTDSVDMQDGKGIAWDISACGPDTYLFQIVRCPSRLCWKESSGAAEAKVGGQVFNSDRDRKIATGEVCSGYTVTAPKAYLEAKDALAGIVDRDAKRWSEHVARYRRLLAKHKEQEDDVFAVALHCFFSGVQDDRELLMIAFVQARASEHKLKRAMASKADPGNWAETMARTLLLGASIVGLARSPPNKLVAEALGQTAGLVRDHM